MSERAAGWYWAAREQRGKDREAPWVLMQRDGWFHFEAKASEPPDWVGPRIPSPDEIQAAAAREARLVRALEPFARLAYARESNWNAFRASDSESVEIEHDTLTVGDFRRAAAALAAQPRVANPSTLAAECERNQPSEPTLEHAHRALDSARIGLAKAHAVMARAVQYVKNGSSGAACDILGVGLVDVAVIAEAIEAAMQPTGGQNAD